MYEIKLEIEQLREMASEQILNAKKERRIQDLEKERNWY